MQPIIPYNSRSPPDKYQRGMFFDVSCPSEEVFSYDRMRCELNKLKSKYPNDVELFTAGQSEGYGGPGNSLEVIGMHIPATGKPNPDHCIQPSCLPQHVGKSCDNPHMTDRQFQFYGVSDARKLRLLGL